MRLGIFVAQDLQWEEFEYPYNELKKVGLTPEVILAPKKKYPEPTAKNGTKLFWDRTTEEVVKSGDFLYDLLIIPGGFAPEVMRLDPELLCIVRYNIEKNKLIAAICHGTQVLLSARNLPKGMVLTGYKGIKHDIENAGYIYPYQDIYVDRNIITCSHYKYNQSFVANILGILKSRFPEIPSPLPGGLKHSLLPYDYEFNHNIIA